MNHRANPTPKAFHGSDDVSGRGQSWWRYWGETRRLPEDVRPSDQIGCSVYRACPVSFFVRFFWFCCSSFGSPQASALATRWPQMCRRTVLSSHSRPARFIDHRVTTRSSKPTDPSAFSVFIPSLSLSLSLSPSLGFRSWMFLVLDYHRGNVSDWPAGLSRRGDDDRARGSLGRFWPPSRRLGPIRFQSVRQSAPTSRCCLSRRNHLASLRYLAVSIAGRTGSAPHTRLGLTMASKETDRPSAENHSVGDSIQ